MDQYGVDIAIGGHVKGTLYWCLTILVSMGLLWAKIQALGFVDCCAQSVHAI